MDGNVDISYLNTTEDLRNLIISDLFVKDVIHRWDLKIGLFGIRTLKYNSLPYNSLPYFIEIKTT